LQAEVPVVQKLLRGLREVDLVALGGTLRLRRMGDGDKRDARCLSCSGLLPELSRFGGRLAQTYDCLDLAARQQGVEPLISIIDERWAPAGCCRDTAVDTVEEGVDQHIAPGHPKLSEKPLEALPSLSHEDASHDGFMLSRILADNQHSRGAIQAPS